MSSTSRRDDEALRSGYASSSRVPPQNAKKRAVSSKYDVHKVKVWLGDKRDHYYILSRFLISRSLTITKIPSTKAVKIALELKKHLVDHDKLSVSQDELEETLFSLMREKGYGQAYIDCYRTVSEFYQLRQPLVIILCGAPCTGKSTIAQQLAARLNMPNVMQTDVICELMRRGTGGALPPQPPWVRNAGAADLTASAAPPAAAAATAGPTFQSNADSCPLGDNSGNGGGNCCASSTSAVEDCGGSNGALHRQASASRPEAGPDSVSSLESWLLAEFQGECRLVRRALQGDFNKALSDGKPLIVEGVHLDPAQLLKELQDLGIVILPVDPAPATPYGSNRSEQRSPPPQLAGLGSSQDSGELAAALGPVNDVDYAAAGGGASSTERCSSPLAPLAFSPGPVSARGGDPDASPRMKRPSPLGKSSLSAHAVAGGEFLPTGSEAAADAATDVATAGAGQSAGGAGTPTASPEDVTAAALTAAADVGDQGHHQQRQLHPHGRLCHKHVSWGRVGEGDAWWEARGAEGAAEGGWEVQEDAEEEEEDGMEQGGEHGDDEAVEGQRRVSWRRRRCAAAARVAAGAEALERLRPKSRVREDTSCSPSASPQEGAGLNDELVEDSDAGGPAKGVDRGTDARAAAGANAAGPNLLQAHRAVAVELQEGSGGRFRARIHPTATEPERPRPYQYGLDEQDSPERSRWGGASSHGGSSPRASTYNPDEGASDVNFGDADTDGAISGGTSPLRGPTPAPVPVPVASHAAATTSSPLEDSMPPIRRAKSHPAISSIGTNRDGNEEEQGEEQEEEELVDMEEEEEGNPEVLQRSGDDASITTGADVSAFSSAARFAHGAPRHADAAAARSGQLPELAAPAAAAGADTAAGAGSASGGAAAPVPGPLPSLKTLDRARSHQLLLSSAAGWHPGGTAAHPHHHPHPQPTQHLGTPGGFVRNCSLSTMDLHTVRNSLAGILRMGSVAHGSRLTPSPRPNRAMIAGRAGSSCGATPSTGGSPSTLSRVFSQAAREHLAGERQQLVQHTTTQVARRQHQPRQHQQLEQRPEPWGCSSSQPPVGLQERERRQLSETQAPQAAPQVKAGAEAGGGGGGAAEGAFGDALARVAISETSKATAEEARCSSPRSPARRSHTAAAATGALAADATGSSEEPQPEPITPAPKAPSVGAVPAVAAGQGGGGTGALPPLFVPVVLRMSEADHRLALEDNTAVYDRAGGGDSARATATGEGLLSKSPGDPESPGPEEVLRRAQTIQQYLCSFENQGMPVVDVTYGNFGEALDVLHEYVLLCIQTAMEQLYESRSGDLDVSAGAATH